ncbi:MAG: GTP pyrophosphokinase [marine bacterium B5-7]|nr:MAG: GTP pyrophosphokinase [marine bacterium B5-7]
MRSLHHSPEEHRSGGIDEQTLVATWCRAEIERLAPTLCDEFKEVVTKRIEILHSIEANGEVCDAVWIYSAMECIDINLDTVKKRFGRSLRVLVEGVVKMDGLSGYASEHPGSSARYRDSRDENFRKLLIAMIDDVRVVLVRLACQLQRLRAARDHDDVERIRIARETQEIFAPLANRLGIWQLKWELEDISFRYLDEDTYRELAHRLAERRVDREAYIEHFKSDLEKTLDAAGIRATIAGRPKHIYSIYKKMRKNGIHFDDVFDVRAVRILIESVSDCYASLGLVHTAYRPIAGEFDDYIAMPKKNGYRSIHTAVIGPQGKVIEVQIRTHDMHAENEFGVAAHWHYKESGDRDQATDSKIVWLRQLLEWKQEVGQETDLFERFRNDTEEERVYVFSPQGKVIDLPQSSTPIDFAYAIHTDIGHQCRGAKVNGRMVPLTYKLSSGEQVEILTIRSGKPSRDWINPSLGYVHTQKARSRILRWFKDEDLEHNIAAGRSALDRELYRLGASDTSFDKLASDRGYRKVDDFLAAIGSGDLKLSQAVASLRPSPPPRDANLSAGSKRTSRSSHGSLVSGSEHIGQGMSVQGVGDLLTRFADCCKPLPGDEIIGYITQSRGITVHRRDCSNMLRIHSDRRGRLIDIDWGVDSHDAFSVDIEIVAFDRKGLLFDVTRVLHDANINVLSTASNSNHNDHTALMRIRMEVSDVEELSRMLARLCQVSNVIDARRVGEGSSTGKPASSVKPSTHKSTIKKQGTTKR